MQQPETSGFNPWESKTVLLTESPPPGSVSKWLFVALVLSVLLHLGLYVGFRLIEVEGFFSRKDRDIQTQPFKVNNVTVAVEKMQADFLKTSSTPKKAPPIIDVNITDYDPITELPDRTIELTPKTKTFQNIFPAEASPSAPKAPAFQEASPLTQALESGAKNVLQKNTPALHQKSIHIAPPDESKINEEAARLTTESKDLFEKGSAQKSISGYSNLDTLIESGAVLGDDSKPILMPTDVLFAYNEHALHENAKLSLMKLGMVIQTNPTKKFIISGHTDSFGPNDYNRDLSLKRAEAVKKWLVDSLDFNSEQLIAVGHGKLRPIVSTSGSVEEQGLNRRVEITIQKD